MDKNSLLTLVNDLIADNVDGEITPSDVRTVLSQMITSDLNISEADLQLLSGPVGDIVTDRPMIYTDGNGEQFGLIGQDDQFGVVIAGRDVSDAKTPITIDGSINLLTSDQILLKFNGAADGDFLRIGTKYEINGQDVFPLGSVPLDVIQYDEEFTKSDADLDLTGTPQIVINGVVANQYLADSSQAKTVFRLVNNGNSEAICEYYITINSAPPTPDDLQQITVPRDGDAIVSFDDTIQTTVNIGDDVQVFASEVSGSLTVTSTTFTTRLTLEQSSAIQNLGQSISVQGADATLDQSDYYNITNGTNFNLPFAAAKYSQAKPFGVYVKNSSASTIQISSQGSDTIDGLGFIDLEPGDAGLLVCTSTSAYSVYSNYQAQAPAMAQYDARASEDGVTLPIVVDTEQPNYQTVYEKTYNPMPEGRYWGWASVGWSMADTNDTGYLRLLIDGVESQAIALEPKDASNTHVQVFLNPFNLIAGSHTFTVEGSISSGGQDLLISDVGLMISQRSPVQGPLS